MTGKHATKAIQLFCTHSVHLRVLRQTMSARSCPGSGIATTQKSWNLRTWQWKSIAHYWWIINARSSTLCQHAKERFLVAFPSLEPALAKNLSFENWKLCTRVLRCALDHCNFFLVITVGRGRHLNLWEHNKESLFWVDLSPWSVKVSKSQHYPVLKLGEMNSGSGMSAPALAIFLQIVGIFCLFSKSKRKMFFHGGRKTRAEKSHFCCRLLNNFVYCVGTTRKEVLLSISKEKRRRQLLCFTIGFFGTRRWLQSWEAIKCRKINHNDGSFWPLLHSFWMLSAKFTARASSALKTKVKRAERYEVPHKIKTCKFWRKVEDCMQCCRSFWNLTSW